MIPQKLTVKNFLSYQQLTLDFAGLHTACICGANGAGKSSLLEAISWAIWGQSRAETEDDIIHTGTKEAQVDFTFISGGETYRVIRTRPKGSAGSLEFQIKSDDRFRSLTERGLRATQQAILSHLKMDYETFVNSAYLRQGRADEFMLKRPSDRKQVLAEILNLSQYDRLTEQAKDIVRTCKGEATALESTLANLRQQIAEGKAIVPQLARLNAELTDLQSSEAKNKEQLQVLERQQQQYQTLQQQLTWQQQQQAQLQSEIERLQQQILTQQQQLQTLRSLLAQSEAIARDYNRYQQLHTQETAHNQKLQQHQKLSAQHAILNTQLAGQTSELKGQLRHHQAQLESLTQQQQELQGILSKAAEIEVAIAQLTQAREQLNQIDRLQAQSSPLLQRRLALQTAIDRESAKLHAKLEESERHHQQLSLQDRARDQILESAQALDHQIVILQKKQVYQQRVHDKGLERRDFLERLKVRLVACKEQFEQIQAKLGQLTVPNAPCPLCDRPLDEAHWHLVQQKHQQEFQELQAEMWLIKEQQAASECEIQVLREEYRQLMGELAQLPNYLEQKGHFQAQLQANREGIQRMQQLERDIAQLKQQLHNGDYCREAQEELQLVDRSLAQLNYDEKNHALARGEVERWRWAEIKLNELRNARRQSENLAVKVPALQTKIQQLTERLTKNLIDLELQQQLEQCERAIAQVGYNSELHQQVRALKEKSQPALLRERELTLAQQQYPALVEQERQTQHLKQEAERKRQASVMEIAALRQQLSAISDGQAEGGFALAIQNLTAQIQAQRSQMDKLIGQIGRLQQSQQHLTASIEQEKALADRLEQIRYRQRIHQELQQAFGKNGIQALTIENVLPQIEMEANQILAQLSDRQLHVRFITQKAGKKADKVIDTLEIEIADNRGTRPYETYSGGEAFRINFAIRLALARILAQRKGSKLQTLIIDEGFGSQDREGCDRLIAAINAIAPDFECILAITHMPQLKEAFNALIEVTKTDEGSQVRLVV